VWSSLKSSLAGADRQLEFASGHQIDQEGAGQIPASLIIRFLGDGDLRKLHRTLIKRKPPAPSVRRGGAAICTCSKSTPAIILNSSPVTWVEFPVRPEAMLILPGLALAITDALPFPDFAPPFARRGFSLRRPHRGRCFPVDSYHVAQQSLMTGMRWGCSFGTLTSSHFFPMQ
jgi:hypothetical protein